MSVSYLSFVGSVSRDAASHCVSQYGVGYPTSLLSSTSLSSGSQGEEDTVKFRSSQPPLQSSRTAPPSSRVRQRTSSGSNCKRQNRQNPSARVRTKSQTDVVCESSTKGRLFTPSTAPIVVPPSPPSFAPKKSASSPQLLQSSGSLPRNLKSPQATSSPSFQSVYPSWQLTSMQVDSEDDQDDEIVFPTKFPSDVLRARHSLGKAMELDTVRGVTTSRDQLGAGETETELDEDPGGLPTARNVPEGPPLIPPPSLRKLTPYLFEISRLLSIVPAVFGTLYNIHNSYHPGSNIQNSSFDYIVAALWSILTGIQCLALTTGLLSRWQAYYSPLSTLIRLVALQGICWPATHFTLILFDYVKRPLVCWVIIGSTTCFSRSVQLWVTSNLWDGHRAGRSGKLVERRWNWSKVGVKCVLPAGILYFVTTWAMLLKVEGWDCR